MLASTIYTIYSFVVLLGVACLVLNFPLGLVFHLCKIKQQNVNDLRNGGEHRNYCHNLALIGFQG